MKNLKKIEKALKNIKAKKVLNTTKNVLKDSNEFALLTVDGVVSEAFHVAEQWQKVTRKGINGGFKLAANQQDLTFQAIEAAKGQYTYGKKRVKKLFV